MHERQRISLPHDLHMQPHVSNLDLCHELLS
jgi:hypothetical protein